MRKEELLYLEKLLVGSLTNISDIQETLLSFLNIKLVRLVDNIKARDAESAYSADTIFFPLLHSVLVSERVLEISINSGYLQNRLIRLTTMSKDFGISIEDARRQFEYTIMMHREMAFNNLNTSKNHNNYYIENIKEYKKFIEEELFKNIRIYCNQVMIALITVRTINKLGLWRWRFKFSPSFRYFRNRRKLKAFLAETTDRVDSFVKNCLIADRDLGEWYKQNNPSTQKING